MFNFHGMQWNDEDDNEGFEFEIFPDSSDSEEDDTTMSEWSDSDTTVEEITDHDFDCIFASTPIS